MATVSLLPVAPTWVLVLLCATALAATWWTGGPDGAPAETRGRRWRLTAAVVLLGGAAVRPGLPGGDTEAVAANLNVYFVVDTTSSILAEDWGGTHPRLKGVSDDIMALADELAGARYSVITFDQTARVRLPLTTDTTALGAAVTTLPAEPPAYSSGSSVTVADDRLKSVLEQSVQRHPERARIVFYLGDGEHTAAGEPPPFTIPAGLVQGGAVLGYGTTEGGRMKTNGSRQDEPPAYIADPGTGADARSRVDEDRLRQLASQLGLPYLHRQAGEPVTPATEDIDLVRYGSTEHLERERVAARQELYWPLLLALAGVGCWELGAALLALAGSRPRREAGA